MGVEIFVCGQWPKDLVITSVLLIIIIVLDSSLIYFWGYFWGYTSGFKTGRRPRTSPGLVLKIGGKFEIKSSPHL